MSETARDVVAVELSAEPLVEGKRSRRAVYLTIRMAASCINW
jgi:hypothetical protein